MKHTTLNKTSKKGLHTLRSLPYARRSSGFTLVEIMLVLGIIALLVGAGIYSLGDVTSSGKRTRAKADLNTLTAALRGYEVDNTFLPTTEQGLMALVTKPASRPAPQNWTNKLKKPILDSWGNPYNYRRPGSKDKGGFDVYSSGPDGQPDTGDDIGNWDL